MSLESIPVKRPVPTSVGTFAGFGPAEERRRPLLIHPLQGDLQDQRRVLQEEGDGRQKVRQRGRERERERQGEKMFLNRSFQNLGWTRFNRWSCKDTVDRLNPLFFFSLIGKEVPLLTVPKILDCIQNFFDSILYPIT